MKTWLARFLGIVLCFGIVGCNLLPWLEATVPLSDGVTIARVMIRAGGAYRVDVQNPYGRASHSIRSIDDGHRRANIYLTPESWLVVIDSGGMDSAFDLTLGSAPRDVTAALAQQSGRQSERWTYLGVVTRDRAGGLTYFTAKQSTECIALYGAGQSKFRTDHQQRHSCPKLTPA